MAIFGLRDETSSQAGLKSCFLPQATEPGADLPPFHKTTARAAGICRGHWPGTYFFH